MRLVWVLLFVQLCVSLAAANYDPNTGIASAPSLGGISDNMMEPLSIISGIGVKIFYIIGAGFLVAAAIRYRGHRANPNHVRMGEVLMLLILGLIMLGAPLLIEQSQGAQILEKVRDRLI